MPGPTYLSGETVDLRVADDDDLDLLLELVNDPDVRRYVHRFRTPYDRDAYEAEFGGDVETAEFLIHVGDDPVGQAALAPIHEDRRSANLGCLVLPEYQGEGYATGACELLLEYGFTELLLHRIGARALAPNDAACHVLEELGLEREGRNREAAIADGEYVDRVTYGILRREWVDDEGIE